MIRASVNALPYGARPLIRDIPVIAAVQRWLIARTLGKKSFVHRINAGPAKGLLFEVMLPMDKPVWAGTYEAEFATAIADAVSPGDVCYDVGAYRGYLTGIMALAGASKVYAFEALPKNQTALHRLCDLNPNLPIEVVRSAIGNFDGIGELLIMPDSSMGKLASSSFQTEAPPLGSLPMTIRMLDTFVDAERILRPNVVKIDVEGAELQVLEGSRRIIQSFRPIIFLEVHSEALELVCSEELRMLGYSARRLGRSPNGTDEVRHLCARPTHD
jgi:FkbM family methyltransferase